MNTLLYISLQFPPFLVRKPAIRSLGERALKLALSQRRCSLPYLSTHLLYFLLPFLPPLPIALLSAFFATLTLRFRQAAKRSPGTKGFTICAVLLLSAARPISQLAWRYWYPGLSVNLGSTTSPVPVFLIVLIPLLSLGTSLIVEGWAAPISALPGRPVSGPVMRSPVSCSAYVSGIWYASRPSLRRVTPLTGAGSCCVFSKTIPMYLRLGWRAGSR
jgi:hypothetical protein